METPLCLWNSSDGTWLFSMASHLHLVWDALAPSYPVCLQPQILVTNILNINTLPLHLSLAHTFTRTHTHTQPQFPYQMAPGRGAHWMTNDKFCSIFSVREMWLPILMTHLIYSHCKLAMRLQVWNKLIFQSSASYNCTQNNDKVICIALISEVHKQENAIVCLHKTLHSPSEGLRLIEAASNKFVQIFQQKREGRFISGICW